MLVYDMRKRDAAPQVFEGHIDSTTGLDGSNHGNFIATNAMDNTMQIWDVRPFAGGRHHCLHVPQGAIQNVEHTLLKVQWPQKNMFFAVGSARQSVSIWDMIFAARR